MAGHIRVLSVYEGFFAGGARALHSGVITGLHASGSQIHSVLSIHREMRRETLLQRMGSDAQYRQLRAAGVAVSSLGRQGDHRAEPSAFSAAEVAAAARRAAPVDIILSLKEQPLHLINHPDFPRRPVIACLHRSDPGAQGPALAELLAAVAAGRVVACVCCAESTKVAYRAAGIPAALLHVIPNGVDLERFRPAPELTARRLRRSLGIPAAATVVTLAARYDPMKDVPLFLRAGRAYLDRDPTGRLLLCGAGMNTDNPELVGHLDAIFADKPALLRRLHLLGLRRDMESIYAITDVVALTSAYGEAAPLCLIEGMMCGAVPVATDVGDCAAIVAGHGIITPPEPHAISAAWTEAVRRRAEFAPAILASRPRFSRARMVASYAALVHRVHRDTREVVATRRAAGPPTRARHPDPTR
jgi:glycosyltransferase involved in cell wall biosynthesis